MHILSPLSGNDVVVHVFVINGAWCDVISSTAPTKHVVKTDGGQHAVAHFVWMTTISVKNNLNLLAKMPKAFSEHRLAQLNR